MRSSSPAIALAVAVLSVSILAIASLVAACGGGQPAPTAPSAAGVTAADAAAASVDAEAIADSGAFLSEAGKPVDAGLSPGQKSWRDMNHDERLALMKDAVLPQMKKSFQQFDAKQFASFSCATCHGTGEQKGTFAMPNPELPQFPKDKGGFSPAARKHPAMMQFMVHAVEPQMASILGLPQWDTQNPAGFGCENCHVMN